MKSDTKNADNFLKIAKDFHLGNLTTEQPHPKTKNLQKLANTNLPKALDILKAIDIHVLKTVEKMEPELLNLSNAISQTFQNGHKVYIYGCGATGRLALSLETIWRSQKKIYKNKKWGNKVVGFMSGGDLALVHSIENFEDHPEWGAKQIREIGFTEGDLLISCTEGGETPSVIGATLEALKLSSNPPFFLYCNPDHILKHVERSRKIIENPKIKKINLTVGPMSLSGSTRLQSTTALMLATGWALFQTTKNKPKLSTFTKLIQSTNYKKLCPFIELESATYHDGNYMLYSTNHYGITILTDTTERSPTFSLRSFENLQDQNASPSLAYLKIQKTKNSRDAWEKILLHKPRTLEWGNLKSISGEKRIYGFDFSKKNQKKRVALLDEKKQKNFKILKRNKEMQFTMSDLKMNIKIQNIHPLYEHLLLKLLLNSHSTLTMGRLNRYQNNIMTWVKPSNNKLIDRAIRYIQHLLEYKNIRHFSYEQITYACFREMERLKSNESIVLNTFKALRGLQKT